MQTDCVLYVCHSYLREEDAAGYAARRPSFGRRTLANCPQLAFGLRLWLPDSMIW